MVYAAATCPPRASRCCIELRRPGLTGRGQFIVAMAAAAGIAIGAAAWFASRPQPDTRPYAGWRNGIIVHVRNCDLPADDAARVRCAALYCAQQVTRRLTNAQQTRLSIERYERDPADGRYHIAGSLDQYLETGTLPTGFTCTMNGYRDAEPQFIFAGRARGAAD